jgi:RNA polymerase sigma-70 factor (ECF subfamily)
MLAPANDALAFAADASPRAEAADETATVMAARSGDRAAFARLYRRYAPMVHGIALARAPASDAADLVQETCLRALDRLPRLHDAGAFGPWLAAITRNLAVEFHRRRGVRAHEQLPEHAVAPAHEPGATNASTAQAHRVLAAIRSLPDAHAEPLVLRLVEGLTGPQIAACLGLTHGSVRVNLHRGMRMLRARLKESAIVLEEPSS